MESYLLSRLLIDAEYRIFLVDLENREVVMTPLPKSLYLFFLKHQEGVLLKDLWMYRDEILEIYMKISHFEGQEQMECSIDDLVNFRKNSIHEKLARIKEAFKRVSKEIDNDSYIVTGKRGDIKVIKLPFSLIIWQNSSVGKISSKRKYLSR